MHISIYFEAGMFVVSGIYLFLATQLPWGKMTEPGSGYFPTVVGVLSVVITAWLLFNSLSIWHKEKKAKGTSLALEGYNQSRMIKLTVYAATIVVFIALFEKIGAVIDIFLLTIIMTKIYGMPGWIKPLLLSVLTAALIYFVFQIWFKIPLPRVSL